MSASTGRAAYLSNLLGWQKCRLSVANWISNLCAIMLDPSVAGIAFCASSISGPSALTIGLGHHLWTPWGVCKVSVRARTTGHKVSDPNVEWVHGEWTYQQNMAWLCQRYQTPANFRRLAKIALCRVPSVSRPAQFDWSRLHHRHPLFRDLSRRFAESARLLIHVAASNLPPPTMRRNST